MDSFVKSPYADASDFDSDSNRDRSRSAIPADFQPTLGCGLRTDNGTFADPDYPARRLMLSIRHDSAVLGTRPLGSPRG
jgi:hypothetical protein